MKSLFHPHYEEQYTLVSDLFLIIFRTLFVPLQPGNMSFLMLHVLLGLILIYDRFLSFFVRLNLSFLYIQNVHLVIMQYARATEVTPISLFPYLVLSTQSLRLSSFPLTKNICSKYSISSFYKQEHVFAFILIYFIILI